MGISIKDPDFEHIDTPDLDDESGLIALHEWDKIKAYRKDVAEEMSKVLELSSADWVKALLFANEDKVVKIQLFKELFVFGERTGLNDSNLFEWYPHNFGPYSNVVAEGLEILKKENVVSEDRKITKKEGNIYYLYGLKNSEDGKKIWGMLPKEIQKVMKATIEEIKGKPFAEIKKFVYNAYPHMAIKANL